MCAAECSVEKKAEDRCKKEKETKYTPDYFLVQKILSNYVVTMEQGFNWVCWQR